MAEIKEGKRFFTFDNLDLVLINIRTFNIGRY